MTATMMMRPWFYSAYIAAGTAYVLFSIIKAATVQDMLNDNMQWKDGIVQNTYFFMPISIIQINHHMKRKQPH
jgi:hypothetical protein